MSRTIRQTGSGAATATPDVVIAHVGVEFRAQVNILVTRLPGLTHWLLHEDPDTVTRALERALQH